MCNKNLDDAVISSLVGGYKKFREKYFESETIFADLVRYGQKPKVLVIACCDSRVDPAILTSCKPGDIFVVRNIANLVCPCEVNSKHYSTSAALEYGVLSLGVSDIVVLGHSHCGGIRALMEEKEKKDRTSAIDEWIDIAKPARENVLTNHSECTFEEQLRYCEKESLLISLRNLLTFPWIEERVSNKKLFLHAWYFNLGSGVIESYRSSLDKFVPLGE